jgi:hypothetical protein
MAQLRVVVVCGTCLWPVAVVCSQECGRGRDIPAMERVGRVCDRLYYEINLLVIPTCNSTLLGTAVQGSLVARYRAQPPVA